MNTGRQCGPPFRTVFNVVPTPDHPRYYDWDWGWLSVWVHDVSAEAAGIRAQKIAEQLPYEIKERMSPGAALEHPDSPNPEDLELCLKRAVWYGASFWLTVYPTGEGGDKFEPEKVPDPSVQVVVG